MPSLIDATARQVIGWLGTGEVGHGDVLDALEARIAAVEGRVVWLKTYPLCEAARSRGRPAAAG